MKINKQDFLNLKILLEEGVITEGKFKNKDIVSALKQNGSIESGKRTAKVRYINLIKSENIFRFLNHFHYHINSIDEIGDYITNIFDSTPSRDVIQKYTSNTKAKTSASLKGLYVSSLKNIDINIDDNIVTIYPQNGMGYFLFHTQKINIFEDTIIVGVENYQVIWFAKNYKQFFEDKNYLFVVINSYMLKWIENIENEYIHFGDYDLAGINIYLNKVIPRLKKVKKYSMFIPDNIEKLIFKSKNFELYEKQKRYKNLNTSDLKIKKLIEIIKKYKRCLEQEGLSLYSLT